MTRHVHHDVEGNEARYKAMMAAALVQARSQAKTDKDRAYIDLQEHFHPLLILTARLCQEAQNNGADDRQMAKVLAITIGTLQAQNLVNLSHRGLGELYQATYMDTVLSVASGQDNGNITRAMATRPMQGSRA